MSDIATHAPNATDAATDPGDWQRMPERARNLTMFGNALGFAIPGAIIGGIAALIGNLGLQPLWFASTVALGALVGAVFGAWLGLKHHRHTFWRLDADGLALRHGRLWQHETRVPASRVQHLDLKRGPLQRRQRLATLVVHTAGTRHSAVQVFNLDEGDAERLRDRLARQIDHDDDA
ncbi:PH domain-containing protein [Montanilutibacter psychrotolerans]|nr:PH domain-containing protein [Lysobacter psychrotolerans]